MIHIVPSKTEHVEELLKNLREQDRLEIFRLGLDPVKALSWSFKTSLWKRTALIDGKVAAMWGVCGTPMSISGQAYLLTTNKVETVSPLRFARIYLEESKVMKRLFPIIENYVDSSYEGAVRLLQIAGFNNEETVRFNNFPFYKFVLRGDV